MSESISTKEVVNHGSIIITTSTMYPKWSPETTTSGSLRGNLALATIKEAANSRFQVVVVDGGSGKKFITEAERLGAHVFSQQKNGMGPGRRQAFKEASILPDAKVVCWTEPEKISIVKDCLPEAILPILTGGADIVVPKRDEGSFSTYPDYQVKSEKRMNLLWNNILRAHKLLKPQDPDVDISFGPKFFKNDRKILSLFLTRYGMEEVKSEFLNKINTDDYANAIVFPIIAALYQGYRVKSVTVPYTHPSEQTMLEQNSETFRKKRRDQLTSIITVSAELIKFLEKNPKTILRRG